MGESPRSSDLADALALSQLGQDDRTSTEVALTLEILQRVRQLLPSGIEPIRLDRGSDFRASANTPEGPAVKGLGSQQGGSESLCGFEQVFNLMLSNGKGVIHALSISLGVTMPDRYPIGPFSRRPDVSVESPCRRSTPASSMRGRNVPAGRFLATITP
jgi:hypothetical protein